MKTFSKVLILLLLTFLQIQAQENENIAKLTQYINNGQLVYYTASSLLSDNNASSITYVDFCSDGNYYSYDGSYTVKGTQNTSNHDSRAYGADLAENSENWHILEYQGEYYL